MNLGNITSIYSFGILLVSAFFILFEIIKLLIINDKKHWHETKGVIEANKCIDNSFLFFQKFSFKIWYKYSVGEKKYSAKRYSFISKFFKTEHEALQNMNGVGQIGQKISVYYYQKLPFFSTLVFEKDKKIYYPLIRLFIVFVFFGFINQFYEKIEFLEYLFSEDTYQFKKASLAIEEKEFEKALFHINISISKNNDEINYYILKANIYDSLKQNDLAIAEINKALQIDSNYSILYNYKGLLLMESKNYVEAKHNFDYYLKENQKDGITYYNRGVCYYNLDLLDSAKIDFRSAKNLGIKDVPDL